MESLKTIVIALVVSVVVIAVGLSLRPAAPIQERPTLGAQTVIPANDFTVGDATTWTYTFPFASGTSTICAVQAPATSTLQIATARFTATPAYAQEYQMGASSVMNSTSTSLGRLAVASAGTGLLIATTSVTALTDGVVNTNQWVVVKLSTSSVGSTFAPTGQCSFTFREL